jgi:hypothetical protein
MELLSLSSPSPTHVSDALGYLVDREFSMPPMIYGERSGPKPF